MTENENPQYLLFRIEECLYAIPCTQIKEVILLPELKCLAEVPRCISGFLNLHRQAVPVIDLYICLGYPERVYTLNNFLVIMKDEAFHYGIIISDLEGIKNIDLESKHFERELPIKKETLSLISSIGMYLGEMVFILDPSLFKQMIAELPKRTYEECVSSKPFNVNAEDKVIFRDRARQISKALVVEEEQQLVPITVIQTNHEYFGLDSEIIKEFCLISNFTPITLAPPHILGFMNLRGSILPLIDIWKIIGMEGTEIKSTSKVLRISMENFTLGFVADEIIDVVLFSAEELKSNPLHDKGVAQEQFIKNAVRYQKSVLGLLDIKKIFDSISLTKPKLPEL